MANEPATDRGRQTKERVLQAAAKLVRDQGVAAVSLDEVQAAAGVGRSQLYHYFDGRDDLLRATAVSTIDAVLARSAEMLAELDTIDGIDRWFDSAIAITDGHAGAGGCPIGSLVPQLAERDERARKILCDAFTRWEAPLIRGLDAMQRRGELRPDTNVEDLADATMAALQGGLLLAQVRRDVTPLRRALANVRGTITAAQATPPHQRDPARR